MPRRSRSSAPVPHFGVVVLHEDGDILVVDKPPGLLTIATAKERLRTAYAAMTDHVREGAGRRARIFIVHRLDRETSGVLVFAKHEEAKRFLQDNWEATRKRYLAVVHGRPERREGVIASRLVENRVHHVYSTTDPGRGRPARTAYRVLRVTRRFALLEIDLLTGRKNQIRVHLADIGHPVVGDRKYGDPKDVHLRLALHASSLTLPHPADGLPRTFESPLPPAFVRLVRGAAGVAAPRSKE